MCICLCRSTYHTVTSIGCNGRWQRNPHIMYLQIYPYISSPPQLSSLRSLYIDNASSSLYPRALFPPLLSLLISQQASQNLPTRTLRDDIYKLNSPSQPLILTLMRLDEARNVALDHNVAVLERHGCGLHNVCFWDLAGARAGYGDHGYIGDGW